MANEIYELKKQQYLAAIERGRFTDRYEKTHSAAEVLTLADGTKGVKTAGRVVALRTMGKALFAHVFDVTGKAQIYLRRAPEAPEAFDQFTSEVAIGDFVGVEGEMFTTKTGEK